MAVTAPGTGEPTPRKDTWFNAVNADLADVDARVNEADLDPELPSRRTLGVGARQALPGSHAFPHAKGAVVLSWDDGYAAWASVLQGRLAERGQRNSFYMTTNRLGAPTGVTAAELLALFEAGHEVGAHSVTHPDMRTLTPAQRAVEFNDSKAAIEAIIGAGNCVTWAYPYGFRNDASDSEAYLRYERVIGAGNGWGASLVQFADRGAFLIPRAAAWNSASHAQVLSMIRSAARSPVLACIFGHVPGTDMTIQELEEALDLIDSLGVPTLTSREAFPGQPASVFNPGFEDGLADWAKAESPANNGQVMEAVVDTPAPGYSGTQSLRLATANDTSFVYGHQTVRMIPGVTHTLSARYRVNLGSGAGYVAIRIQPQDNAGNSLAGTIVTSPQLTSTTWAQATVDVLAGPTAKRARVDLLLLNRLGEAWFDHVHFGPKADGVLG